MDYQSYLMHFNPNRDPRNGQFAKGHGNSLARAEVNAGRKMLTAGQKIKQNITSKRGKNVIRAAAIFGAAELPWVLRHYNGSINKYNASQVVSHVVMRTGRAAIIAGLATYGTTKMVDFTGMMAKRKKKKSK